MRRRWAPENTEVEGSIPGRFQPEVGLAGDGLSEERSRMGTAAKLLVSLVFCTGLSAVV